MPKKTKTVKKKAKAIPKVKKEELSYDEPVSKKEISEEIDVEEDMEDDYEDDHEDNHMHEDYSDDSHEDETEDLASSILKDKVLIFSIVALLVIFGGIFMSLRNTAIETSTEPQIEILEYNGYIFEKHGDIWSTTVTITDSFKGWERQYEILFHYSPKEVEDVETLKNARNISISPNLFLDAQTIYITMDPEYPSAVVLSGVEIAKIIGNVYEKGVKGAITRPDNRTDAPVITCNDIAPAIRIIKLELGNETKIYSDKGCIVVQGTDSDELLRASERLTYEMLKIL